MSVTREQDFREVRRLLGDPVEKRPTPDLIVSNMIAAEQHILNRLSGTAKPWTYNLLTLNSVVNQGSYDLTPLAGPTFGKALFVYRDLTDNVILPVPFTEFGSELTDQRYQLWVAAVAGQPVISGDKLGFYRTETQPKVRIFPIPREVRTYTIIYASGAVDWDAFQWSDEPALPEFARFRQLLAALATLAKCEWDGYTFDQNRIYRQELRTDLQSEIQIQEAEFRSYIRNPSHESNIGEVGYWYE